MHRIVSILAAADAGEWTPGFHDNDLLDWVIALGYLVAAAICMYAWSIERGNRQRVVPAFWLILGILMAMLGVNKQLNFQTLLGEIGRDAAEQQGWYERRRTIQKLFIIFFAGAGLAVFAAMCWWVRRDWRRYTAALGGLALAGLYAVVRAATFHHMLREPGGPRHHPWSQEVLEVGAVTLVSLGAWWAAKESRRPKLQAFERTVRIR